VTAGCARKRADRNSARCMEERSTSLPQQLCGVRSRLLTLYTLLLVMPHLANTSCACPAVAAIVGVLGIERQQRGKPPLGFLNPLIYQNPQAFNDIKTGHQSFKCDGSCCGDGRGGGVMSLSPQNPGAAFAAGEGR
jgi:hypothetical protein